MPSLRKYITSETELAQYVTISGAFDQSILTKAEEDIDKFMASWYEIPRRPSLQGEVLIQSSDISFGTTSATLSSDIQEGYYTRTVIEILSGDDAGKNIFVNVATKSGSDTVLNYDTQALTTVTPFSASCRIYQLAKFPQYMNEKHVDGVIFKIIPNWLKQAVAYQYNFRKKYGKNFNQTLQQSGYSINADGYSESFGGGSGSASIVDNRISPEARDILDSKGLTVQSL